MHPTSGIFVHLNISILGGFRQVLPPMGALCGGAARFIKRSPKSDQIWLADPLGEKIKKVDELWCEASHRPPPPKIFQTPIAAVLGGSGSHLVPYARRNTYYRSANAHGGGARFIKYSPKSYQIWLETR